MSSNYIYNSLMSVDTTINEFHIKRYMKFIEVMRTVSITRKTGQLHHILPKCLFPEYTKLHTHQWNGIMLSFKAHRIAHRILAKAFPVTNLHHALRYFGVDTISGTNWYNDGEKNIRTTKSVAEMHKLFVGRESTEIWKNKTYVSKDGNNYQIYLTDLDKYLSNGYTKWLIKKHVIPVTDGVTNTAVPAECLFAFLQENKTYKIGQTVRSARRKNNQIYHKNDKEIRLMAFEVDEFEKLGWKLGRSEKTKKSCKAAAIQIHHGNIGKRVSADTLPGYLEKGWKIGIPPCQSAKSAEGHKNLITVYDKETLKERKVSADYLAQSGHDGKYIVGRSPNWLKRMASIVEEKLLELYPLQGI